MTLDDTKNLFEQLLSKYFQNHPKLKDPAQVTAYHEILEPYEPADVKAAVLRCLREKRYFPDPQEIASRCPVPAAPAQTMPSMEAIQDLQKLYKTLQEGGWLD